MNKLQQILNDCETDLRAGRAQKLEARLQSLNFSVLPREALLPLAHVARRGGLFMWGLKALNKVVRPGEVNSGEEMAEYAVLLQKIGANEEAAEWLALINKERVPVAHLYQAFQHFHEWDGEAAIVSLEQYLQAPLQDYERAVARVNLAAAYLLSDKKDIAEELLKKDAEKNHEQGRSRLEGNCHEMLAQLALERGDYDTAYTELYLAGQLFAGEETPDARFVKKWRYITDALKVKNTEGLQHLRNEALGRHEWELVRDMDLFILKISFAQEKFQHLYYGTPFPGYRSRAVRTLGIEAPSADSVYLWGYDKAIDQNRFDLKTGRVWSVKSRAESEVVEGGSKLHQLLLALSMDLYRPLRVAGLFAALFPEEKFDPFSSSDRVHRLVSRSRKALQEAGLQMKILHKDDAFLIKISSSFHMPLRLDRRPVERQGVLLSRLGELFGSSSFGSAEACQQLGVSASVFKRMAAWAISQKLLEKQGAGATTLYRIVEK